MTREEVLQVLTAQVGALGPFGSPAAQDDQWKQWLESVPDDAVPPLLSLLREPPVGVCPDEWSEMELKIAEALGAIGRREPAGFVAQVASLLSEARPRPVLLDALGMAQAREALPVMSALLDRGGLTEVELVHMAGALGSIGGMGAARLLDRMEPHAKDKPAALAEIGVAREILAFDRADSGVMAHHLVHALKGLPQGAQGTFLEHALPLMERDALRKPLLELLGAVHSVLGLGWLASKGGLSPGELALCAPLERSSPGDGELIRWLRALGAMGGAEAKAALEQFGSAGQTHSQPVQRELEQSLAIISP